MTTQRLVDVAEAKAVIARRGGFTMALRGEKGTGMNWRVFQGHATKQIDGHTTRKADRTAWYYEPRDYEADVLYSGAFQSREDAEAAAEAEFATPASLRLDSRIDAELTRLGWSSETAPAGASTLDCWQTERTGIVSLHDPQEVTLFEGEPLLAVLTTLSVGIGWEDLWRAILPYMVDA